MQSARISLQIAISNHENPSKRSNRCHCKGHKRSSDCSEEEKHILFLETLDGECIIMYGNSDADAYLLSSIVAMH